MEVKQRNKQPKTTTTKLIRNLKFHAFHFTSTQFTVLYFVLWVYRRKLTVLEHVPILMLINLNKRRVCLTYKLINLRIIWNSNMGGVDDDDGNIAQANVYSKT